MIAETDTPQWCNLFSLPPANEVCEGYVFTPVCQSFCSQGGCLGSHLGGRFGGLARRVSRPTSRGRLGVWPGEGVQAHTREDQAQAHGGGIPACTETDTLHPPPPTPAYGYCCGRYASYWNAFLFIHSFLPSLIHPFIHLTHSFTNSFIRNGFHGASPHLMGVTALSTWRYQVPTGFGIQQVREFE